MHILHTGELEAVHQYFRHVVLETNSNTSTHILEANAAEHMIAQQDASSCGVYCAMIADCLPSDVDITLLTPTTIIQDRQRIAQILISQHAPFPVTSHVTTTTESLHPNVLPKFIQKGTSWHPLNAELSSTSDQYLGFPTLTVSELYKVYI